MNENSGTYENVEKQIKNLISAAGEGRINGTYSSKHLLDTYSAGIQHAREGRKALFIAQSSDSTRPW